MHCESSQVWIHLVIQIDSFFGALRSMWGFLEALEFFSVHTFLCLKWLCQVTQSPFLKVQWSGLSYQKRPSVVGNFCVLNSVFFASSGRIEQTLLSVFTSPLLVLQYLFGCECNSVFFSFNKFYCLWWWSSDCFSYIGKWLLSSESVHNSILYNYRNNNSSPSSAWKESIKWNWNRQWGHGWKCTSLNVGVPVAVQGRTTWWQQGEVFTCCRFPLECVCVWMGSLLPEDWSWNKSYVLDSLAQRN